MLCIDLKSFALKSLGLCAVSFCLIGASAAAGAQDYTKMRGNEIKASGTHLRDGALYTAFSNKTHYGTYILNTRNEVTATYVEAHFAGGRVAYSNSTGHKADGEWMSGETQICYRYDGYEDRGETPSCFEIYALEGCYYFFNSDGIYDGYSVTRAPGDGDVPSCFALIG